MIKMIQATTFWWIATGLLIIVELFTGTIYLLMLSSGLAAGAIAAHWGMDWPGQMGCAAAVGFASIAIGRRIRQARQAALPEQANTQLQLDIGAQVHVPQWQADGRARVAYRGSWWTVALASPLPPSQAPAAGSYRISAVQGTFLLLEPLATPSTPPTHTP